MKKIKLTRRSILEVSVVLESLGNLEFSKDMYEDGDKARLYWQKFVYAIARNLEKFQSLNRSIKKIIEPPLKFKEYNEKRIALAEKYADTGSDGKPIISNNNYIITKKRNDFDKEIEKLKEEYKDAIKEYESINENFANFIEEEDEVEIYTVKEEYIPLTLNANQVKGLLSLTDKDVDKES